MSGFFLIDSPEKVDEILANLGNYLKSDWDFTKKCKIKPEKYTESRSLNQNNFFQALTRDIAKACAEIASQDFDDDWHEYMKGVLKRRYGVIRRRVDPISGEEGPYLLSTKLYPVGEMMDLITQSLVYAATLGITIEPQGEYKDLMEQHG